MAVVELHPDEVEDHPSTPSHPSGKVTAFDEHSGLPIVRRDLHSGNVESEEKEHGNSRNVREGDGRGSPRLPVHDSPRRDSGVRTTRDSGTDDADNSTQSIPVHGKIDEGGPTHERGRDVLHQSTDRDQLVSQAKAHAKQFEDGLKSATRGIAGARFDDVRPEKNPARIDEKVNDEQQPIETIPDILAGRIGVDSPEAHEKTAAAIGQHFKVVRDEDEFEKGDPEYGYRVHKMQVQVTPQLSGEVHIVPKEVLEVNDQQHESYKAARDAEVDGDDKDAAKNAAKAKKINDAAMAKFNERNGVKSDQKGGRGESPATAAGKPEQPGGAETKYRFGSTQVNLPPESDAHKAIIAMQGRIPKEHFANDGTDEETDKPHVTVRYGVKGDDTKGIKDFISKQAPFDAKLGKTMSFPVSEHSDGAAPVVASVESPERDSAGSRFAGRRQDGGAGSVASKVPSKAGGDSKRPEADADVRRDALPGQKLGVRPVHSGSGDSAERAPSKAVDSSGRVPKLARGQTVLVGDSHGVIRGGNPNFASGGRWSVETPEGTKTVKGSELTAVVPMKAKPDTEWDAYDLDKTLAKMGTFKGPDVIGKPISPMVDQVKADLKDGKEVRIFTARVADDPKGMARAAIEAWSQRVFGVALPVTNIKDRWMRTLYDDRARQVEPNTGKLIGANA